MNRASLLPRRRLLQCAAGTAAALTLLKRQAFAAALERSGLGQAYKNAFRIGAAVSTQALSQPNSAELELVAREFTSITPENCMKWENIRTGDDWHWDIADKYVAFGQRNHMYIVCHNLIWHSQIPRSVFQDANGQPLARNALLAKMEQHINTLAGRYKGRIQAWDVVNEALDEGNGWRKSAWFNQIGADFMEHAFRFAHQADPNATLLYNDYNTHLPKKTAFFVPILRDYLKRGVPIHGIGMQCHHGMDYPDMRDFEASLKAYIDLGLEIHITELDFDVLPARSNTADVGAGGQRNSAELDPYKDGLPEKVAVALADRYEQLFTLLLKYRPHIKRVTTWGSYDGMSWKNDFPVRGRTNYPLLFDRQLQPKLAYQRLLALAKTL
ncbi:MAG TPA: endo-1,4-beta-xylanase [Candidatus Acidoferrum sp.]|nr:endo-1,4-beta-xylanase [Candidatus Acidoferrum sp.]